MFAVKWIDVKFAINSKPKYTKCEICNKFKTKIHKCNGRWCLNCKTMVEMNHKCFILTEEERQTKKPMQKFSGYIFFDYECMNDNGEHIPNLIVADKICVECLKTWQVQMNIVQTSVV